MSLLRVYAQRLLSVQRISCSQCISTACINREKSVIPDTKTESNPTSILKGGRNHKVDNMEKRFLVWTGKYKTIDEVPPTVPQEVMEKARNKARIRISNYLMLATALACIGFVYSGKAAAKRGESVQKMNMDWHKQINAESANTSK